MGVAKALREVNPKVKIVAVEPSESAVMSGETDLQPHEIAGIGDGFIPEIVNMAHINDVVKVKSTDAIRIAKRFIREQGLMVGVSSGVNFYSALKTAKKLGPGKTVVTVLPDRMERYFSTNLFK
jgi:cysteine synthase A